MGGWAPARLLIDGALREADGGERFAVLNPATEEVFGTAPAAGVADVDAAIGAARGPSTTRSGVATSSSGSTACASCTGPSSRTDRACGR
jgi:hypothetical protein